MNQDCWNLVNQHLTNKTILCSLSLVCKQWRNMILENNQDFWQERKWEAYHSVKPNTPCPFVVRLVITYKVSSWEDLQLISSCPNIQYLQFDFNSIPAQQWLLIASQLRTLNQLQELRILSGEITDIPKIMSSSNDDIPPPPPLTMDHYDIPPPPCIDIPSNVIEIDEESITEEYFLPANLQKLEWLVHCSTYLQPQIASQSKDTLVHFSCSQLGSSLHFRVVDILKHVRVLKVTTEYSSMAAIEMSQLEKVEQLELLYVERIADVTSMPRVEKLVIHSYVNDFSSETCFKVLKYIHIKLDVQNMGALASLLKNNTVETVVLEIESKLPLEYVHVYNNISSVKSVTIASWNDSIYLLPFVFPACEEFIIVNDREYDGGDIGQGIFLALECMRFLDEKKHVVEKELEKLLYKEDGSTLEKSIHFSIPIISALLGQ